MSETDEQVTYKDAGVDIEAGERLVSRIAPLVKATARAGTTGEIGGFGGLFDLARERFHDPLLVAATDGVGTKLKIAFDTGKLDSVGIDLVAMCVNDIIVQGAEPLFFLDYFATGALDVDAAEAVIGGIAKGCEAAGCALIGGETAEMPGLYKAGEFDLAGFAVGAVERGAVIDGANIAPGDELLGLAANGFHSNGYSLIRKLVGDAGLALEAAPDFAPGISLGDILLRPTRIYVRSLLDAIGEGGIRGLAHITGGGLLENLPRILPDGTAAVIDAGNWPLLPEFDWARQAGNLGPGELLRTFNCGVGMVAVAEKARADGLHQMLEARGETVFRIGRIEAATKGPPCRVAGDAGVWGYADNWTAHGGDVP